MGFSGLMGFIGGASRAGEQVLDKNMERMDAAGVARAREEAQIRLEERIQKTALETEGRRNKREDFTHARGLMDDKAKLKDSREYAISEDQRKFDLEGARLGETTRRSNESYTGSLAAKDKLRIDELQATSARDVAGANNAAEMERLKYKTAADQAAGGAGIKETDLAARYKKGKEILDVAYNVSYNAFGMADPSTISDKPGYYAALARLERETYGGQGLPASLANEITKGAISEKQGKEQREAKYLKEKEGELGFFSSKGSNVQKDSGGNVIVPDDWQPKGSGQTAAPKTETSKPAQKVPSKAEIPEGHEHVQDGVTYKWSKAKSQYIESAAPATPKKATGLMQQSNADAKPADKTISVSKTPAPLMSDGSKRVSGLPRDGVFQQNVIYIDGKDRFEIDAQGNRKDPSAQKREQPKAAKAQAKPENEFEAIPMPKNLKDTNSKDIYFEKDISGKNIYYTVVNGSKKIKLDIEDSI